jgi:hypothetical protein
MEVVKDKIERCCGRVVKSWVFKKTGDIYS